MDKKKLKLSISGNTKKTISNIEQAKSNLKIKMELIMIV